MSAPAHPHVEALPLGQLPVQMEPLRDRLRFSEVRRPGTRGLRDWQHWPLRALQTPEEEPLLVPAL